MRTDFGKYHKGLARRTFVGGSDARIILGNDEAGFGAAVAREARRG
jgi:hypothetical protein